MQKTCPQHGCVFELADDAPLPARCPVCGNPLSPLEPIVIADDLAADPGDQSAPPSLDGLSASIALMAAGVTEQTERVDSLVARVAELERDVTEFIESLTDSEPEPGAAANADDDGRDGAGDAAESGAVEE